MKFRNWAAAGSIALAATLPAQAATVTFDNIGDSFSFVYSATIDGAALSAVVTYTLTAWNNSNATMSVSAQNTSSGLGANINPNRLVAFGVGFTNPDLISANVQGVSEWDAKVDTLFPGGPIVQLCNYAGANCLDDTGRGVYESTTDTFDVRLGFASRVEGRSITFGSPFESKWQGVGASRLVYGVTGCLQGDTTCTSEVSRIPEPLTLALVAGALVAGSLSRRRPQA